MTIPPRWSELIEEDNQMKRTASTFGDNSGPVCAHCGDPVNQPAVNCGYGMHTPTDGTCITCGDWDHTTCPMMPGCGCCWDTYQGIRSEGNHNRFAVNDTANDELYMGENIGPIVTGDTEENPDGILVSASSWVTADVLPPAENPAPDVQEGASPVSNVDMPETANIPQEAPKQTSTASAWTAKEYLDTIQKQASDSDVFYRGYSDATSGKEMDEGMANLSMDYYQGYKQGLLYNEPNLVSAPPTPQDINERTHYEMEKSAPYNHPGVTSPK